MARRSSGGDISYRLVLGLLSEIALLILVTPVLVVLITSFTDSRSLRFPPPALSLRWYRSLFPYSLTANDSKFGSGGFFTAAKDGFDVLYREGKTQPKMMSLGLHLRLIGHPSRAAGLERALDYIGSHKDVWFTRRLDIAQHWSKTHPAPAR